MPSDNVNSLLVAWASSLILVLGGVLLLELSYTPPNEQAPAAETAEAASNPSTHDAKGEHDELAATQTASHSDDTIATSHESADAHEENIASHSENTETPLRNYRDVVTNNLPAPGQKSATASPSPSATISVPHGIPIMPLAELYEETKYGPLPIIAEDGRRPFDIYAAPKITDAKGWRIAILVTGLGKRARATQRALNDLPTNTSLAFSVYGSKMHDWGQKARILGHEVFLEVPMEPSEKSQNYGGPLTLLVGNTQQINTQLLRSSLGNFSGYVGIVNQMGSRFTVAADSMRPVLDEIKRRGLMFVDSRTTKFSRAATMANAVNMPWAVNNQFIDDDLDAATIGIQLANLEKRAKAQGAALGIARAYPVTFGVIKVWAATLEERGFVLVPVSSIANQQALPRQ